MKKLLTIFIFLLLTADCLLPTSSIAQPTFQKIYGGTADDWPSAVEQTTDGGYIVAGNTESFGAGGFDVYLMKTGANGDMLWTRTYGGGGYDLAYAVEQTSDGGYIVAGHTESFGAGSYDMYLIKTDANGDTLWTRTYGGAGIDYCWAVQQTSDSGYIVAGWTDSFGAGFEDVYLIKTDANGDTLWTKIYGGGIIDYGYGVRQTTDGGYIVVGMTMSFGAGFFDVYLIKTNANGDILWNRTYGGGALDGGGAVRQTNDGGYIIVGNTASFRPGVPSIFPAVYLIKTDSIGDTLWTRSYGGGAGGLDVGTTVEQTDDMGYIVVGTTWSFGAGDADAYLIKTNSSGDMLWTKTYGGAFLDGGRAVKQTNDGGYIVAGSYGWNIGTNDNNVYLIKTDADGNSGCNQMNTNTIVSGGAVVGTPATIVGSGAVVNSTATVVTSPAFMDSTLCEPQDSISLNFIASDTMICVNDCINFSDSTKYYPDTTSFPIWSWQWSFPGAAPNSSTDQHPLNICYAAAGTYDVTLIVSTLLGLDTLTKTNYITVIDPDSCVGTKNTFFIPNSFSPNGDGDNDVLFVKGSGIKNLKLFIYNRWGEKVFQLSDNTHPDSSVGMSSEGWDGTYRGKKLNTAVFAWYAEVEFENNNKIYRKGNVTLIK